MTAVPWIEGDKFQRNFIESTPLTTLQDYNGCMVPIYVGNSVPGSGDFEIERNGRIWICESDDYNARCMRNNTHSAYLYQLNND